ncbi:hypothetical protein [Corynebacterium sp.]|uniref:DUF6973 domain-containing protein n=1 Tax=Corynebacterium sp. TaxID=1720 RepID=UPI0026DC27E7|nr:hypothetical protein [Corynebacterium sp.]MDO5032667.1 hypothetical protein [Corynebacterium sp.]
MRSLLALPLLASGLIALAPLPASASQPLPQIAPVPEADIDYSPARPSFDPLHLSDVTTSEAISQNDETDALINGELTFEEFDSLPIEEQLSIAKNLELRTQDRFFYDQSDNLHFLREKAACVILLNVDKCQDGKIAADDAVLQTIAIYGKNGGRDEPDAFRHCYWSALMTLRIDEKAAKIIGDNHEKYSAERYEDSLKEKYEEEMEMDLFNNAQGRKIGSSLKLNPLKDLREPLASAVCHDWAGRGVLKTLD